MRPLWLVALAACGRVGFDDVVLAPDPVPAAHCPPLLVTGTPVVVTDVPTLVAALAAATPSQTIALADGRYVLTEPLRVSVPGVTVRSMSGDPRSVVLDGAGAVSELLRVEASSVTIADLTVTRAFDEAIMVEAPPTNAIGQVTIYNITSIDNGLAVRARPNASLLTGPFSDDGTVACSRFVSQVRPGCENRGNAFGVRIQASRGWTIRDNVFSGVQCPSYGVNAIAAHEGSRDTKILDNVFVGLRNNIRVGSGSLTARTYGDPLPAGCSGTPQHRGGIVCNNRIAGLLVPPNTNEDFDDGISLWSACDALVVHNTITSPPGETFSAIEYRFAETYARVFNNIVSAPPLQRDGGTLDPASQNLVYEDASVFLDARSGNLRLAETLVGGAPIDGIGACQLDADDQPRDLASPTPGAYER